MLSVPTERRRIDSLRDIVKYCDQVEEFAAGFTRDQFEHDRKTYNAVLYSLQTIGEAAIRLDKEEKRLMWRVTLSCAALHPARPSYGSSSVSQ